MEHMGYIRQHRSGTPLHVSQYLYPPILAISILPNTFEAMPHTLMTR